MLVKKCDMPDINDLEHSVVGHFLLTSLAGFDKQHSQQTIKTLSVISRLMDKAKYEYDVARETAIEEEKENKLTYEELMKRDSGQYMYTCPIINHLENCINALSRIFKLIKLLPKEYSFTHQKKIIDIRNAIEHMDERISSSKQGSLSLNISEDALAVEITGEIIKLEDVAGQIRVLYKEIRDFIYKSDDKGISGDK